MTRVLALALLSSALVAAVPAMSAPPAADDFSATLDARWTFSDPAASQQRFRELLARTDDRDRALEIETQIARTEGLLRRFDEAHATLARVEQALAQSTTRVRVRYLLERGRVLNTSGQPARAVPLFREAANLAARSKEPGAAFYRVDALHMLGIATPPAEQLDWNLRALAAADASTDARTRGWRASLLNNIGWTYFDRGDARTALGYWEQALVAREAAGNAETIRIARWTVARGLRALGRLDEAEAIQRRLVAELEAAGETDGYVFEELCEIALARGYRDGARPWAAKAHAALRDDPSMDAARLAHLAEVAGTAKGAAR